MPELPVLHPELGLPVAAELRACEACRLKGRGEPVPGEAWGDCSVMLIGEAPGPLEAKTGRPFVGPSGQRLRRLLEEAGIKDFYLTNTVRHWPPRNRVPKDDELEACLPFLAREIAVIQPKVIVLIGETAMCLAFKAKGKVKKFTGRWGTLAGIPTAGMIHPAAIGRMTQKDRGAWEGACLSVLAQARRKAEGWELPKVPWTDAQSAPVPLVSAFDIETTGTDPRTTDMVLAAAHDGEVTWVYTQPLDITFARDSTGLAHLEMHHSAFDAATIIRLGILSAREMNLDDSMVLAHVMGLLDLSLSGLSSKLLDEPTLSYGDLFGEDTVSIEDLSAKCARDVVQTRQVLKKLKEMARPEDLKLYEEIERPLLPIFAEMTALGGFDLDQDGIQTELKTTTNQMEKLDFVFRSLVDEPTINIKSGDQVAEVLKNKLGLPLTKLVPKKDRVAVDASVLRGIQAHHPCVGVLLQYRILEKRKSTYLLKWSKLKRLTALWHQTGTRTGRSSSSGPNLQNIPNNLRKYLTARPGKKFVAADYSQVEYRVAAHLSQDPAMIQAYLDGRDMHDETARMMWPDADEITSEMRRRAKILNFGGILYGGSPDKMLEEAQRYNYPLTYKEAEDAIRQAQRERPTYYAWSAETAHRGLTDQYIDGLYDHRFYLAEGLSYQELNKLGRQAVNYPIQGGARDIVKVGMAKAWSVLLMPIVADNHDELIFEVDAGEADEFALALKPILEENNPLDVPLLVDIRVGFRWKE